MQAIADRLGLHRTTILRAVRDLIREGKLVAIAHEAAGAFGFRSALPQRLYYVEDLPVERTKAGAPLSDLGSRSDPGDLSSADNEQISKGKLPWDYAPGDLPARVCDAPQPASENAFVPKPRVEPKPSDLIRPVRAPAARSAPRNEGGGTRLPLTVPEPILAAFGRRYVGGHPDAPADLRGVLRSRRCYADPALQELAVKIAVHCAPPADNPVGYVVDLIDRGLRGEVLVERVEQARTRKAEAAAIAANPDLAEKWVAPPPTPEIRPAFTQTAEEMTMRWARERLAELGAEQHRRQRATQPIAPFAIDEARAAALDRDQGDDDLHAEIRTRAPREPKITHPHSGRRLCAGLSTLPLAAVLSRRPHVARAHGRGRGLRLRLPHDLPE